MIVKTEDYGLPSDADIISAVITYNFGVNGLVYVQFTNVTNVATSTFNILQTALICELKPVTVDMTYQAFSTDISEESIQDTLEIQTDELSEGPLTKHKDIFSTGETDIESPIICYKYNKPIYSTVFNYNKLVTELDIENSIPDS